MDIKKMFTAFGTSIFFIIAFIAYFIACLLEYSLNNLLSAIFTGLCSSILIVVSILSINDGFGKIYCIAANHEYYFNGVNIFDEIKVIKERNIIRYRKNLKYRTEAFIFKECIIKKFNLRVDVYELKDDYQLLVFSSKQFIKEKVCFDCNDYGLNNDALIDKIGISEFEKDCIEKYFSDDKKIIITITLVNDKYIISEYHYTTGHSFNIKNVFSEMMPYWQMDGENWGFDTIEQARKAVVEEMNYIKNSFTYNGKKMSYFILPLKRVGTSYHEFQTGDKCNVFWDKTSILLHEDIMEEFEVGTFFERFIPNYDYYGVSIVNKETWGKILEESKIERKEIQDIVDEMKVWADHSLSLYGCFTIVGI